MATYYGTTAASSLRNPPRKVNVGPLYSGTVSSSVLSTAAAAPNAQGANIWSYCSTALTTDLMDGTYGDFADGHKLGMRPGDIVMVTQFTSAGSTIILSFHVVADVSSTSGIARLSTAANSVLTSTYA